MKIPAVVLLGMVGVAISQTPPKLSPDYTVKVVFNFTRAPAPSSWTQYQSMAVGANLQNWGSLDVLVKCPETRLYEWQPEASVCSNTSFYCPLFPLMAGLEDAVYQSTEVVNGIKAYHWRLADGNATSDFWTAVADGTPVREVQDYTRTVYQYDYSAFQGTAPPASVFAIPPYCSNNTKGLSTSAEVVASAAHQALMRAKRAALRA
eukprot:TRINITY_DN108_c0_g1_i1.p1 TRINITY_DN108_c0_g1~~TRINITY_DN108_c0_g1_i1.p1  ORF type:complete len:221 (+),score=43.20 TRINITY_DN108_c0_g1_i1:47-664(+)